MHQATQMAEIKKMVDPIRVQATQKWVGPIRVQNWWMLSSPTSSHANGRNRKDGPNSGSIANTSRCSHLEDNSIKDNSIMVMLGWAGYAYLARKAGLGRICISCTKKWKRKLARRWTLWVPGYMPIWAGYMYIWAGYISIWARYMVIRVGYMLIWAGYAYLVRICWSG